MKLKFSVSYHGVAEGNGDLLKSLCPTDFLGVWYSLHTSGLVVANGCDGRIGLLQKISAAGSLPTGMWSLSRMHFEAVSFQRCQCFWKFRASVVPTVRYGLGLSPGLSRAVSYQRHLSRKSSETRKVVLAALVS